MEEIILVVSKYLSTKQVEKSEKTFSNKSTRKDVSKYLSTKQVEKFTNQIINIFQQLFVCLEIPFHQIGGEIKRIQKSLIKRCVKSRNTFPPNRWRNNFRNRLLFSKSPRRLEIPFHQIGGEILELQQVQKRDMDMMSRNTFPPNRWRNDRRTG